MRVHVRVFAAHRELLGRGQFDLDVPVGATPENVYQMLEREEPGMSKLRSCTTFAINRDVVPPGSLLQPGDEVAFLQPVSGGSRD